jgi:hypothetical protein
METYKPIAKLLRERVEECSSERVLDLCSGAGGPWPCLARHFETQGTGLPEVLLTDKYPSTTKLHDLKACRSSYLLSRALDRRDPRPGIP